MGITAPGTSTGQTVLNVNGATTGGDLVDIGTGGTWASGVLSGQTIVDAFTPTGVLKMNTAPTVTTPGTGFYMFGTEGTEPASIASGTSGFVDDSTSHCPIAWFNATNEGCPITVAGSQTVTGTKTMQALVASTNPIRDTTAQVLVSSMTAVSTAGVNVGSTGAGNSTFSWAVTATNAYRMTCHLPVTFVSSATIRWELVSISGSVTVSTVEGHAIGDTGAAAALQDVQLSTIPGTSLAQSETAISGAPGGVSEWITLEYDFISSHAGNIGLEFIGNGTNNVQLLIGGSCTVTQTN